MKYPNINEDNFENAARYKESYANLTDDGMCGEVEWLTQESEYPSDDFNREVIRAFKEAGAKINCAIKVSYGIRDYGLTEHYQLFVK